MKLNNRGWGYRMMCFLIFILVAFLLVAIYYIYVFYGSINTEYANNYVEYKYVGEE
jgi:hypothetical protein